MFVHCKQRSQGQGANTRAAPTLALGRVEEQREEQREEEVRQEARQGRGSRGEARRRGRRGSRRSSSIAGLASRSLLKGLGICCVQEVAKFRC